VSEASLPTKSRKNKSQGDVQRELRDLAKSQQGDAPSVDMSKLYIRVGGAVVVGWVLAAGLYSWQHTVWPIYVAAAVTAVVVGAGAWLHRYVQKTQALGSILRGADTADGRKEALEKLKTGFKKDDAQALIARAQLEMQDDPKVALETLESINLGKVNLPGMSDQVRAMRANLHLSMNEPQKARVLVDQLELGKQQEPKTRAMLATVSAETWARTGAAKKAVDTLDLFDPEDESMGEMRIQMYRARAFAYAANQDMKNAERALKKLADTHPHLLAMFIGKKIHPLLERAAKQLIMRSGAVPRKMVRQRM
jgi:hypothetical protein